jgi:hypothetical protein
MTSVRFPYEPYQLPYLEVSLAHAQHTITSHALVDSGSCVNVLPLKFGQAMDFFQTFQVNFDGVAKVFDLILSQ